MNIGPILFGLFLLLFALAVIIFIAKLTILEVRRLDVSRVSARLISYSLLGTKITEIKKLQGSTVKKYNSKIYRLMLITDNATIPFSFYYISAKQLVHKNSEQINNFIALQNQFFLKIKRDNRLWGYLFSLPFIIQGIITIFSAM